MGDLVLSAKAKEEAISIAARYLDKFKIVEYAKNAVILERRDPLWWPMVVAALLKYLTPSNIRIRESTLADEAEKLSSDTTRIIIRF